MINTNPKDLNIYHILYINENYKEYIDYWKLFNIGEYIEISANNINQSHIEFIKQYHRQDYNEYGYISDIVIYINQQQFIKFQNDNKLLISLLNFCDNNDLKEPIDYIINNVNKSIYKIIETLSNLGYVSKVLIDKRYIEMNIFEDYIKYMSKEYNIEEYYKQYIDYYYIYKDAAYTLLKYFDQRDLKEPIDYIMNKLDEKFFYKSIEGGDDWKYVSKVAIDKGYIGDCMIGDYYKYEKPEPDDYINKIEYIIEKIIINNPIDFEDKIILFENAIIEYNIIQIDYDFGELLKLCVKYKMYKLIIKCCDFNLISSNIF